MKTLVFLTVCGTVLQAVFCSDFSEFKEWQALYKKEYVSEQSEVEAFRAWKINKELIAKLNKDSNSWKGSLNQYADLSIQRFQKKMLMPSRSAAEMHLPMNNTITPKKLNSLPASFDWRSDGSFPVVTKVRDQGSVGSCWAFSTAENIEGQWALAGHTLVELSPEFLVDCDGTSDGTHADCSVFGGWPYLAYQYIISSGGIPSEQTWPYCSGTGKCYPCMQGPTKLCGPPPYYCDETIFPKCATFTPEAKITSWNTVSTNEEDIQAVLVSQGPLSVLLDATQLQFYKSGIWDGEIAGTSPLMGCHSSSLNHAVLLVGYGEENGQPFWTVKNSWGQSWGEDGYFRITRGTGKCGINTAVTTSIV
jgi:cathepsin F